MKILVAGTGLAGILTALRLSDNGHDVDLIEKMSFPGGISIISGGAIRVSNNWQQSFTYLKHTNGNSTPEDVLKSFAQRMENIPQYFENLCNRAGSNLIYESVAECMRNGKTYNVHNYGFEGWESLDTIRAEFRNEDFIDQYPSVVNSQHGCPGLHTYHTVYKCLQENLRIRFDTSLDRLIQHRGKVVGAIINGDPENFDKVVLATGGFESNDNMKLQYWQGKPVLPSGFFGNTGDGHAAASAVGADSWHMWHYHGTYGFQMPGGYGARIKGANVWMPSDAASAQSLRPLHHILVDQQGRRFMNEYPPYITDTGHRPLELYNAERVKHDRIPAYFISDETGRSKGPWGSIRINSDRVNNYWSNDNQKEISEGIFKKFATLEDVADYIGCEKQVLAHTLQEYNKNCAVGEDPVYLRPVSSLHPIDNAPYYVAEVYPIVGNTQGGPVHNKHRQVMNSFGEPIDGLYTAGECGSIFGDLYLSSGNLSECFTSSEAILDHISSEC